MPAWLRFPLMTSAGSFSAAPFADTTSQGHLNKATLERNLLGGLNESGGSTCPPAQAQLLLGFIMAVSAHSQLAELPFQGDVLKEKEISSK